MYRSFVFHRYNYGMLVLLATLLSCRSGSVNLFKPASPHQAYRQKLINAGLDRSAMGSSWISNADESLKKSLNISIPYKETGYFAAERIPVSVYRFTASRGQKLKINLVKKPDNNFVIYTDVWEIPENGRQKLIAWADTTGQPLELDIKSSGIYLVRLQPELLSSGQYTLEISSGPSLGFPVKYSGKASVQSYFGDGRDAGSRKHEGIDIFAAFRTPVVAAAAGTVQRVNENNLGGKVVWLRPIGKDYTLYYAHLDEQLAIEGQQVLPGDTLGLMGNTGNAHSTPPHLHFGIYTSDGAIDPYPFVNTAIRPLPAITASINYLNDTVRSIGKTSVFAGPESNSSESAIVKAGTIIQVTAVNSSWYTVQLPNGYTGFIPGKQISSLASPLRKLKITSPAQNVYDRPDSLAAIKTALSMGKMVDILGHFENYLLIADGDKQTGWIKELNLSR
ncbi:peptidoglycan DD-metalloendopeptidase family protein [Pedobacter heparinus]|uniref:peptidoglycan DD-metalloendopeptidase family protein n=1 Tax=Pedobacter heparinus TaxID=984 RepID=UPI002930B999|nr:peptidoglycan DD-metalloendopeptidase family protein [Pedobacter heparinus]